MASVEAVECLTAGHAEWLEYVANQDGQVDLSFADLREADLRGRRFEKCDLTSARLVGATLDSCHFSSSILTAADLTHASLVGSTFCDVYADNPRFDHAVFRQARLENVTLRAVRAEHVTVIETALLASRVAGLNIDHGRIEDLESRDSDITDLVAQDLHLHASWFTSGKLRDWQLTGAVLADCSFNGVTVEDWTIDGGALTSTSIVGCDVKRLDPRGANVLALDLSRSVVKHLDISSIGPDTAVLLDTALVGCKWPPQAGRVTWTGRYVPSPWLIAQPVQDVKGVPPITRREIADAQYVVRKQELASGKTAQGLLLRLWGATSSYGQSVGRLAMFSAALIVAHALALVAVRAQLHPTHLIHVASDLRFFLSQLRDATWSFVGASTASIRGGSQHVILISARIVGFAVLGLWIGIAANKLGRLGAE